MRSRENKKLARLDKKWGRREVLLSGLALPVLGMMGSTAFANTPTAAWVPPRKAKIEYDMVGRLKGASVSGTGVLDWVYAPSSQLYSLELEVSALLLSFLYASKGTYSKTAGFMPTSYREKRLGKDQTVIFDYEDDDVIYTWKPRSEAWPLVKDTQDVTSVMLQIAHMIAKNPLDIKVGQTYKYPVARMGTVKFWNFSILSQSAINTAMGAVQTWHISRIRPKTDPDLQVEFWLAPELSYLPMQISFNRSNNDFVKVTLKKLRDYVL